ncbi:hypothetical protein [Flavobacterium flavigenum]|uniref:hypothetical protein n=1 Tax=Flavobacterium flavigenum TaxID=3003258 RepID=UPI0022ABCB13|nr:hypothetical protein [Flavobacterium flavigenum]
MKIYSQQNFENMKMMSRYFESNSKVDELYLLEFRTSNLINNIIENEDDNEKGIQETFKLLAEIESLEHKNDSHWLDYKIHVMCVLRENGFNEIK